MESPLISNVDVATEVFSRLPTKTLALSRCVSKRLSAFISSPSFLRLHSQNAVGASGLLFQGFNDDQDEDCGIVDEPEIIYICLREGHAYVDSDVSLAFLPEKVIVMASSNGLLCCRSCIHFDELAFRTKRQKLMAKRKKQELVIYICNPATEEWIALRPTESGCEVGDTFALSFFPFGSSENPNPSFKLVSIQRPRNSSDFYSFVVYSSETGRWITSKEVCHSDYRIHRNKMVFVGTTAHWLTWNHHIISFDVEKQVSANIKLPGPFIEGEGCYGVCLGGAGGYLHYVCVQSSELRVWMLKDYNKPDWMLKHCLLLLDFYHEHANQFSKILLVRLTENSQKDENVFYWALFPLAFYDDVLYMMMDRTLFVYNFRTRKLERHCWIIEVESWVGTNVTILPYNISLSSMGVLKEDTSLGGKSNGKQGGRKRRRPQSKTVKQNKLKL